MLTRIALPSILATLAIFAAATDNPTNQCNTGETQCCNTVQGSDSSAAQSLLTLLGIVISDAQTKVGITCTPISIAGIGQGNCSGKPVCCSNNNYNGIIAIGCVPINVNL